MDLVPITRHIENDLFQGHFRRLYIIGGDPFGIVINITENIFVGPLAKTLTRLYRPSAASVTGG